MHKNISPLVAFLKYMSLWQDRRFLWGLMAFVCVALVCVSHLLFQRYGFMKPCEQCVYIRYAFLVMALGGIIATLNPRNLALKIIAYILAFYGCIRGIAFSIKLNIIHRIAHSDELVFGVQGCQMEAKYDFGLPLDRWLPSLFNPTGECGFDYPMVSESVEGFRRAFVEFYADGWYLIPSMQFGNMAQCTLFAFAVCGVILTMMCVGFVYSLCRI